MSLRQRMVLFTAAAVALAVILSAVAGYLAVDNSLRGRIDRQLKLSATNLAIVTSANEGRLEPPGIPKGERKIAARIPSLGLKRSVVLAVLSANGAIYHAPNDHTPLRPTSRDIAVARGDAGAFYYDSTIGDIAVRVYLAPAGRGRAVMAAESLTELNSTLHNLATILIAIALSGIVLAGLLGLLVARAAAKPVHALRKAAEHVGSTGDLTRRIRTLGNDDVGKLGEAFNEMLVALAESQRTQQQLIGDASHELRTPIASLRMNLEVLAGNPDLRPADRDPLLVDLIEQSTELGALVDDLLESARNDVADASVQEQMDLRELVSAETARWARKHPEVHFVERLEPCEVIGQANRIRRAVSNILDNAIKWTPPGGSVEVVLANGQLSVRDYGSGFFEQDIPHVFDRFYRSPLARSVPGSGLGLSIVRKVAAEHQWTVHAQNAPGGGALIIIDLPTSDELPGGEASDPQAQLRQGDDLFPHEVELEHLES